MVCLAVSCLQKAAGYFEFFYWNLFGNKLKTIHETGDSLDNLTVQAENDSWCLSKQFAILIT